MNSIDDAPVKNWAGAEGKATIEDWEEPPADDPSHGLFVVAKRAFAVFRDSRKGKGKGKGPSRAAAIPKGAGKPRPPRCVNRTKESHTAANCPHPRVPANQRKCFTCQGVGHQASKCPNDPKRRPTAASAEDNEKVT